MQIVRGQFDVQLDALLFLHLVDELFKVLLTDLHNNVGEHLDKSSVAVPCPARIAGFLRHDLDDLLVETEIQNGIHHAGHRSASAGTNGNEQGILKIAELFTGDLFHLHDILEDLRLDLVADLAAVLIILGAGFGRDRKALRNRQPDLGHFREVCALAAEQRAH